MEPYRILPIPSTLPLPSRNTADLQYNNYPSGFANEHKPDVETNGLLDYLRIILSNRRSVIVSILVGMLLAMIVTFPQAPVYRARTTLEIQGVNNEFLNSKQVSPVNDDGSNSNVIADIQTQIKIINSENLVDRVVDRLNASGKLSAGNARSHTLPWQKWFHFSASGSPDFAKQFRNTALSNLTVSQISQTRMIEVYFKSSNPELAADFINLLDSEYIESNIEARWKMSQETSKFLEKQIDEIRQKLERSELELQRYARGAGLLFSSVQFGSLDRANVSDEKLRQMQEQVSRAQEVRTLAQSHREMAKGAAPDTLGDVLNDQPLRDLQRQITDLRRQDADLSSVYTSKNEKVQRLRAQISLLEAAFQNQRTEILNRIENDYQIALRHENLLRANYQAQAGVILDQADKSIRYNILKRDVDTNRQLYDSMLQQVKASSVASAIRASNIRIVDPAKVPSGQFSPNLPLNVALGGFAGCVFGIGYVLVRKSVDRTFQKPGDLQFWTRLSELGTIPSKSLDDLYRPAPKLVPGKALKALLPGSSDTSQPMEREQRPSMMAEAFRTVLTSVLFSGENGTRPKVLALTSANASEGKTTVTTNLALALAEIRLRVVVVDADLRRPRMHQIFALSNERGLSTILSQEILREGVLDGVLQPTSIPGVHVLPSGPPTDSAANLLHSPNLRVVLDMLRDEFDMVLIDTPPAFQLTDSRIIGKLADSVILIARAGLTTRDSTLAVASRFNEDRTHVLGTILNDWIPASGQEARYIYDSFGKAGGYRSNKELEKERA